MATDAKMTPDDVRALLTAIVSHEGDDETQHGLEDSMYRLVLEAIATDKCDDPAGCAKVALTSSDFDFARWCA